MRMGSFGKTFDESILKAIKIPYTGIVHVQLTSKIRVEMEIIGNSLVDPQLVIWSDSREYACFELAMTHPDIFDTPKGAFLEAGGKAIKVTFIKRFFVED